jgi:hypothetical protein
VLDTEEHPEITVSSKRTRKAVFFIIARFFLESFARVAIGYEAAHGEEWARTSDPHEWAIEDYARMGTSKASTKSLVECGRKLYAICDFNLIEKHVRGNTAIPLDVNELTPQVIDDTLDGALGETPDQPFVGSDLFRGTTSHAVLAQVDHLRTPPSDQRSAVTSLPGFDWRQFNAT